MRSRPAGCHGAALPVQPPRTSRTSRLARHRVSLVGLGTMGQRHLRVLASLSERFEVTGAWDLRADLAPGHGAARLGGESEAIARADVVVVATPIDAHAATVVRALSAGRHVLVEKPLCATASDAAAALASATRGALFVGHSERFNPVVRALARLVRGEAVASIDLHRVGPTRPTDHGVLLNLGVHDLDLGRYLGGGDVVVRDALGDDSFADVLFETTSGASGHLHVDRRPHVRRRELSLTTAQWIYEGDLLAHRLVRTSRTTGARTEVPLPLDEPLAAQARALADALDGGPVREIATGADGLAAVRLAEQCAELCASRAPESAATTR